MDKRLHWFHTSLANSIGPRGADFGRTPVSVSAPEHAAGAGVLERQRQPVLLNVLEARLQCLMDLFIERRIADDQGAFACIDARPMECGFQGVAVVGKEREKLRHGRKNAPA